MQSDSPSGSSRMLTSWYWIAVLVVTVTARGGILAAKRNELQKDPDGYRNLARTLRATGTLGFWHGTDPPQNERVPPTAFRPPLYPLLLATVVQNGELSTSAVAGMHCVLGLATVVLTVGVGRRLGLGPEAWLAGLVVAVDPILLNQSTQVMTETLATFLAMLAWRHWLGWGERLSSGQAVLTGLAVGLAALCRPTFLPWWLLLIVAALFHTHRVAPVHSG